MKEKWLLPGAFVPVDVETTAALVAEIKRLIDVVGSMALAQPEERNFCQRCGKRTADLAAIHTCTPPQTAQYSSWGLAGGDEFVNKDSLKRNIV